MIKTDLMKQHTPPSPLKGVLKYFPLAIFILTLSIYPQKITADDETCTYTEGMFICVKEKNGKLLTKAYCNYRDSKDEIEVCQKRITENKKYRKYYKKEWKDYCEERPQNRRTRYCKEVKENFEFYRDEFLNIFKTEQGWD